MGLDFNRPYLLLILPIALGIICLIYRKNRKKGLKRSVSLLLRCLAVTSLCFSIASTGMVWKSDRIQLLVLADRSESMRDTIAEQERLIREIESVMPQNVSLGVLSFGADTKIEKNFEAEAFTRLDQQIQNQATDFEQAVRFGAANFSTDATNRILLLTDGRENRGDTGQVSTLLDAQNIRVDAWLYETKQQGDAQISQVDVPQTIYQNEKFDIYVDIESEIEKKANLIIYSGKTVLSQQEVLLQKGNNRFVFQDTASEKGLVDYRAVLQETGGLVQNNQKSIVSKVLGTPNLLLVEGAEGEASELTKMLSSVGLSAECVLPQAFPFQTAELQKYEAVIFVNVNAADLQQAQLDSLSHYVKTLGRGFVLIGGDNSYALGGYIGSDLEKILPIESNVRNKLDVPSLAMVMAIDHSGSMSETDFGLSRLILAKEAAQRAVEQLTPQDSVGVIAFDDTAKWIAELQSMENEEEIKRLIGGIAIGGGTMMYSSLQQSYDALMESDAAIKHVILLTDGQPADSGFEQLIAKMREDDITVSCVAMGSGANTALMKSLSTIGGGRFYQVDSDDNIPAIFAKETQLSTQSFLQNRTFYPEFVSPSSLTEDFSDGIPQLTGFLATVAKPTATVALQSDNGLPILAQWQYGAGQVVAWTSDTQGTWSESYLSWDRCASFFGGFINNVLKEDSGQGYLSLEESGGTGSIRFEVQEMDQTDTSAVVIAPDGSQLDIPMQMEKPGIFSAKFTADQEGIYAVQIVQKENGSIVNQIEGGMPKGYSAEYDIRFNADLQSLNHLMSVSGGSAINDINALFDAPNDRIFRQLDLTLPLLLIGLLLFFLDILCRRLQWEAAADRFFAALKKATPPKRVPAVSPADRPSSSGQAASPSEVQPSKKTQAKAKTKPASTPEISSELLARRKNKR